MEFVASSDVLNTTETEPHTWIWLTENAPMELTINGEPRRFDAPISVAQLLQNLGLDARKVALERNLEIVPRSAFETTTLGDGDKIEIVHFIGGGDATKEPNAEDTWTVAAAPCARASSSEPGNTRITKRTAEPLKLPSPK